jgi:hypothetical protein
MRGHWRIVAYRVVGRLALGLQPPRGWVGLAFDDDTAVLLDDNVQFGVKAVDRDGSSQPSGGTGPI